MSPLPLCLPSLGPPTHSSSVKLSQLMVAPSAEGVCSSELEHTTCSHLQIPVQSSQMQLVKTPRETASSFQTRVLSNLHATVLAAVLIRCSVTQSCPTLGDPMDCSTPGLPVLHHFPELAPTHVHQVGDAIQPSRPLSSPSPLVFNLSKHQGLSNESILHIRWPKYWELQLQHQSFQ